MQTGRLRNTPTKPSRNVMTERVYKHLQSQIPSASNELSFNTFQENSGNRLHSFRLTVKTR